MTTYKMLVNWTDQGVQKIKDSPRRFDMAKQALGEMGGQFKSICRAVQVRGTLR